MQTREKNPRKKFSNNLDSNNFETKQSEKIQNILPFSLRENRRRGKYEGIGRFVTKLSNCFIDKSKRAVLDIHKNTTIDFVSKCC